MDVNGGRSERDAGENRDNSRLAPPEAPTSEETSAGAAVGVLSLPVLQNEIDAGFELRGVSKSSAFVQAITAVALCYAFLNVEGWVLAFLSPAERWAEFSIASGTRLVFAVAAVGLAGLFLVYHQLPLASLGVRRNSLGGDAIYGVGAGVVGWVGQLASVQILIVILRALVRAGVHLPGSGAGRSWGYENADAITRAVFLVQMAFSVIGEEAVYRAIVLPRAYRLFGRWSVAIVLSGVLHMLIHASRGPYATIALAVPSLIWSYVFVKRRSIVSSCVSHWVYNLMVFGWACANVR